MNRNLSTFEEIMKRSSIVSIDESERRAGTYIVTFEDGTQSNVDYETKEQLYSLDNP